MKFSERNLKIGIVIGGIGIVAWIASKTVPVFYGGTTISNASNLCDSPLGAIAKAFGGNRIVNDCALANGLNLVALIAGIAGLVAVVICIFLLSTRNRTE